MKIIALYLPQFHKVPENDAWWGKDFTDWVSTKNGFPMFEEHYQPHIPMNNNYYNLLEKEVMEWQAKLMHDYQVDGLCFYHYWFKDGKKMLEKPAENLLLWKDIDMPYCFCWANMSWARSWAKMKDMDFWINEDDIQMDENGKALLIEQTYGSKEDWKKHFEYLLPFFLDQRYIKIDNRPIIWIYRTDLIDCIEDMVNYWNELAKNHGLNGIYVMGSYYHPEKTNALDAAVIYEPGEILPKVPYTEKNNLCIYNYDEYWNTSIRHDYSDIKTYYTGLVNYDDTPRQGNNGHIISGTPLQFEQWLKILLKKSEEKGNELVFLNAWNEWGEGNHLEPDEKYSYQYLEAILKAKQTYKDIDFTKIKISPYSNEQLLELNHYKKSCDKTITNLEVLEKWMLLKQKGISLSSHPNLKQVKHIAIYGYGLLGKLLLNEFNKSSIQVDFFIDKNATEYDDKICVQALSENLLPVDLIIVSLPNYYYEILNDFHKYKIQNYILIDEIIKELERMYYDE